MSNDVSRSSVLISLLGLPLTAVAVANVAAPAEAKTPPSAVEYTPESKNGKFCKNCRFYVAAKALGKPGTCTIVAGPIAPQGWCVVYAPK
jgi:hypothetical protein